MISGLSANWKNLTHLWKTLHFVRAVISCINNDSDDVSVSVSVQYTLLWVFYEKDGLGV